MFSLLLIFFWYFCQCAARIWHSEVSGYGHGNRKSSNWIWPAQGLPPPPPPPHRRLPLALLSEVPGDPLGRHGIKGPHWQSCRVVVIICPRAAPFSSFEVGYKINCMLHKSLLGPSGKLKTKNSKSTIIITITLCWPKGKGRVCCQHAASCFARFISLPSEFSTLLLGTHLTLAMPNPTQYTQKKLG